MIVSVLGCSLNLPTHFTTGHGMAGADCGELGFTPWGLEETQTVIVQFTLHLDSPTSDSLEGLRLPRYRDAKTDNM